MNAALVSTRDGIGGYWNTQVTDPVPDLGKPEDKDIFYLRLPLRAQMLDHALSSSAQVRALTDNGTTSGAGVSFVPQWDGTADIEPASLVDIHRQTLDAQQMRGQLELVRSYADLRIDRVTEIQIQQDDILSFYGAISLLDEQRRLRSLELLGAVVRFLIFVEMQVKHLCRFARPVDLDTRVQPMIQTPDHSSFPSGHATEAFAVATVMHRLMTGEGPRNGVKSGAQVFRLATRIAVNRTIAGVHFPMDSAAGAVLGCAMGEHVFALAMGQANRTKLNFDTLADYAEDFSLDWLEQALGDSAQDYSAPTTPDESTIIGNFWKQARAEWP